MVDEKRSTAGDSGTMTEKLCFACTTLADSLRDTLAASGLPRHEAQLWVNDILDHNLHVRACAAMSAVLATGEYLTCSLLQDHRGEHAVRLPASSVVRLMTIAKVAEQVTGAVGIGDARAAALALDLLAELLADDGPSNGMLP